MKLMKSGILLLLLSFALLFQVHAEENKKNVEVIGTFDDWKAYVTYEKKKKICYMVSFPKRQEGDFKKRGKVYAMITHRPAQQTFNVVSFNAGYKYQQNSKARLILNAGKNKKTFELFTDNESAWALADVDDQEITKFITRFGENLVIEGISSKGSKTKDVYSLKGSLKAYKAISEACEVTNKAH